MGVLNSQAGSQLTKWFAAVGVTAKEIRHSWSRQALQSRNI